MKKTIFSALFVLLFTMSQAQIMDYLQDVSWGVKAGVNYSKLDDIHAESKGRIGFNAGGFAMIPLSYGNEYYIQPELLYFQKGETNDVKGGKEVYQLDYIDIPILFKAYFSDRDSDFFGVFGPKFSFLINDNIKNKSIEGLAYHNDQYGSFNFGLVGGIGYSYQRKWEMNARVEYGLSDAVKDGKSPETKKVNNHGVVSLGIGYIF